MPAAERQERRGLAKSGDSAGQAARAGQVEPIGRVAWIDLAKGAGILLVAVGHLTNGAGFSTWLPALENLHLALYLFHMPLFFLLGGMVLHPRGRGVGEFTAGRARGLLVAYYVFSLYFLAKPLAIELLPQVAADFRVEGGDSLEQTLWSVAVMGEGLWFLWAYFWAQVAGFVAVRWLEGREGCRVHVAAGALGVVLAVGLQALRAADLCPELPFQLMRGLWGAGYVLIGYALMPLLERVSSRRALVVGLVALGLFVLTNQLLVGMREPAVWGALIRNNTYGLTSGVVSLVAALLGSLAVVLLARAWGHNAALETVGRDSLAYYALSPITMNVCKLLLFTVLGVSLFEAPMMVQLVAGLALALASVALSAPIVGFANRHAPWLLGRRSS